MRRILGTLLLLGAGCADKKPYWAADSWWWEPTDTGIHGFQTWQLYPEDWKDHRNPIEFLCTAIVEFSGTEGSACPQCTQSWDLDSSLGESDCDAADIPSWFTGVSSLGIGEIDPSITDSPPYEQAQGSWTLYDQEWLAQGWAFPAKARYTEPESWEWDDEQAFAAIPAWAVNLQSTP